MTIQHYTNLFHSAQLIIQKEEELKKAKGESFNVFSILRMESKENDTHSNFLGNLLDPNGTHLMGSVFLSEFLKTINAEGFIDISTTQVYLEYNCGKVDHVAKTGGRIDIYLKDINGKSISIENKIYAGDQPNQIERYVNHNKGFNRVYYLTLEGKNASKESRGELNAGTDYFTMTYRDDIVNWLESCTKEAVNAPIVRETIKQYRILIQKLTKTIDTVQEQELQKLILSNYEASELIARNFDSAKESLCSSLRNQVCEKVNELLVGSNYEATLGHPITTSYSQIWIKNKKYLNSQVFFGIEPFGIKATERMFIGTFRFGDNGFVEQNPDTNSNKYWCNWDCIDSIDQQIELNMSSTKFILFLNDSNSFDKVVNHIVQSFVKYFEENRVALDSYLSGLKN
jgi:hypothetical protein